MQIDPSDFERLCYGGRSKKTRRTRTALWLTVLIAIAMIDLGLLAIDLASRNTSVDSASQSGVRANVVRSVPAWRTLDTSSRLRRLTRAEL
ncbi:hypothetical protein [Burkholderia cepacia]|uniref:hypothetical protein n=1 Tax=Burkholderia cepacia TaxID=292 RepID=UPI0012DAAF20|nr:hypothetical protein [Burkholderia cepacia]